jgi:RNA polymerase-interacting CarD/CdnL/TRCF family regulator
VVRDLEWRRKQGQRLNVPGERIYKKAMLFLTGELAVSQNIDVPTAEKQVSHILNDNLSSYMAH